MTEEVTIKLRTEVEGTEDVEKYRGQMAQVQKQTETATKTAQKASRQMSASALNVNKLAQNLGKLSPTLGKITQSINRMTTAWKRYDAQAKNSTMTDMPNQLANTKAGKASRISTGAKVAGVALAAGAASMIFNAITGSGSKLAGFDKLNTLGSPSILDPIIPYLKGIDDNTEKTAEATSAINTKMDGPKGGVAVPIAVGLSVPATEYENIFNGLENYQKEANTRVWQDYESKAQSTLTKVKEMANVAITPAKQAQQTADKIVQTARAKINKEQKEDNRVIPDGFYMTPSGMIAPITDQATTKEGGFNWYTSGDTQYALSNGGGLFYNQDGTPVSRATPQAPAPEVKKEWWNAITDPLGEVGGAINDGLDSLSDMIGGLIPEDWAQGYADHVNEHNKKLDELSSGYLPYEELTTKEVKKAFGDAGVDVTLDLVLAGAGALAKGATKVIKAMSKAQDTAKVATETAEETAKKTISVTTDGVEKTTKVMDDALEADRLRWDAWEKAQDAQINTMKGITLEVEEAEKVATAVEENIRKSTSKLEDLYLRIKGDPFVDSEGVTNLPVAKVSKKGADIVKMDDLFASTEKKTSKVWDTVKSIAKTTGIIGVASMAVDGLRSIFGFAEGGVFEPNRPQLAILGDNRSQPEVAAPYNLIVQAVGDAIRANQGAQGAMASPTKIEVPVSLNGKVIARAVYDDLESERRRRNGSVVL